MKTTLTFEEFKANAENIKENFCNYKDIIDIENGKMLIYTKNLSKYLEQYSCKSEEELSDILYYHYGVFLTVIDN